MVQSCPITAPSFLCGDVTKKLVFTWIHVNIDVPDVQESSRSQNTGALRLLSTITLIVCLWCRRRQWCKATASVWRTTCCFHWSALVSGDLPDQNNHKATPVAHTPRSLSSEDTLLDIQRRPEDIITLPDNFFIYFFSRPTKAEKNKSANVWERG